MGLQRQRVVSRGDIRDTPTYSPQHPDTRPPQKQTLPGQVQPVRDVHMDAQETLTVRSPRGSRRPRREGVGVVPRG